MQVKADKENEVKNGHDGTWVAHPALVPIAKGIFDAGMKSANQLSVARSDINVTAADLLAVPEVRQFEGIGRQSVDRYDCNLAIQANTGNWSDGEV